MSRKPYIAAMCSGKGGTGKSVITANLAYQIAERGKKCLVWDADSMFPNQHLMFGVEPQHRLSEVYAGETELSYAIFPVRKNLALLPDSPGTTMASEYGPTPLLDAYEDFPEDADYDIILLDTAAGAGPMVMQSCYIADTVMVMLTDEPTSLIDAYGLIKLLKSKELDDKVKIVVNNVIDEEDADEMYSKLTLATEHFLDTGYDYLGHVEYDRIVRKSIINQNIFSEISPESEVAGQVKELADRIIDMAGI